MPVAHLVAIVLGVFAIIWNQQQTNDNLRTELRTEIAALRTEMGELRAEFSNEIAGLRAEFSNEIAALRTELRTEFSDEIGGLRVLVVENGQRLARIEGFLGIGIPDSAPQGDDRATGDDRDR